MHSIGKQLEAPVKDLTPDALTDEELHILLEVTETENFDKITPELEAELPRIRWPYWNG